MTNPIGATPALTGSAVESFEQHVARIQQRDADVKAWAYLDLDLARSAAEAADAVAPKSSIHGITVGLKDIIETGDQPTGYGSPIWEGHRPAQDAVAVRRLREAGAVIMGKTTTTEFATYEPTATRNPRNLGHTPGGSSSGSAAAVADGQVQVALGTQTAGSVNRPGSFCGDFTLKPTFNRWPFQGVLPVALTFDTLGGFARDPRDLARLDYVLSSPRPEGGQVRTRTLPALSELRVGVVTGPWWNLAEPEAAAMLESVADELRTLVRDVKDAPMPAALSDLQTAHALTQSLEAGFWLVDMMAPDPSRVSDLLKGHIASAKALNADQIEYNLSVLRDTRAFVADAFEKFDVLITLAAPGEAPITLETTGDPAFNRLASTAGVPSAGVPVGVGAHGLPLGLQIIAPANADQALMELVVNLSENFDIGAFPGIPA